MTRGSKLWALPIFALLLPLGGCTNTVRYLTTMRWLSAPPGPGQSAAAPAGGADSSRTLYVTYWEGSCSSGILGFGRGCSLGDSKIRRCNVKPDNLLECVDEAEATQAFARQK